MNKKIKKIARNLHAFAKIEIVRAYNKYSPKDKNIDSVRRSLINQRWEDLPKPGKRFFYEKAILILTK